ncbi:MAG: hypothetical protein AB2L11_07775 [Syntrophobacteraceae bacterium]
MFLPQGSKNQSGILFSSINAAMKAVGQAALFYPTNLPERFRDVGVLHGLLLQEDKIIRSGLLQQSLLALRNLGVVGVDGLQPANFQFTMYRTMKREAFPGNSTT